MRVLVTGGAGFIGSHIVEQALARGHDVCIIDDLSSGKKEFVFPEAQFHELNILADEAKRVINDFRPEVIIHQAAQTVVQKSLADPVFDAEVNVVGTIHLLQAARACGCPRFVFASSAAVYGDKDQLPISEEQVGRPLSFYGSSKYASEHYIDVFSQLYGISTAILRYSNVYGVRQDPRGEGGVISIVIEQAIKGDTFHVFGDGLQTRDYINVRDVAAANIRMAESDVSGTFNVCTAQATSLLQIVDTVSRISGKSLDVAFDAPRAGDILHSALSYELLHKQIGWKPTVALAEGLKETYDYYAERAK